MLYIPYDELKATLAEALAAVGFGEPARGRLTALFAENTLDGGYSHGANRFPRFLSDVRSGLVNKDAAWERVGGLGGMEIWDGHLGVGPLIAEDAMDRAVALSKVHGIAGVSVRNTNHWMKPARYGWRAAKAGVIGICWSNTGANTTPWGAMEPRVGNNPLVLAIPRQKGAVVVDMAMSQFAYGKLELAVQNGEKMPQAAGFDAEGRLTDDPAIVMKTRRLLPMGYWKGTALSVALDLIATATSLGNSVAAIAKADEGERGLSQVFMAIDFRDMVDPREADAKLDEAVDFLLSAPPALDAAAIHYPGQNVPLIRAKNLERGVPVHEDVWAKIKNFI